TRDRAATQQRTGSPSTRSTWRSTRARSTPTSPPGSRVRERLLDGRHLRVEDPEGRLDEEKASLGTLEVVDSPGPYFQVEGCPSVHHRDPAPPGVDAPLHDHGRVGLDADVDELEGAAAGPDGPRHSPAMSLMDVIGFSGGSEAHPARRRAISAIRAAARAGRQP